MTSSRRFDRLLQAGCLGLIGMLTAAGCGGSSSPTKDASATDGSAVGEVQPQLLTQLTVNPPSVNFETVDVGVKSAPLTVTVTNAGNTASGSLIVAVSGAGVSATGCAGVSLPKGGTCQISVTVQAAVAGQITGSIDVGDAPANMKKINVSGVAIAPGQFTLAPSPLDLGPVLAGAKATGIVVMTNAAPTGLSGIVTGVSGAGFAAGTGTCTATLAIGQTCNIVIDFTAGLTSGAAKGTLTVSQGGVTKTVALSAMVQVPAKLVMTPVSATLQTVVGTPSSPVIFYVANSGDVASAIPTVTITGANKDDFSFVSGCATALEGGAKVSCPITVTYNPKAAPTTSSKATLTVAEPGTAGSSASAALTGTANAPSDLAITGTATDFGTVVVGGTSPALTFTVTNNGGVDAGLIKVTGAGQFVVVTDNCSDKGLAALGTCTFTAVFKPAAGDQDVVQGQFKATGAAVANPAFFGVTGNAVPAAKLAVEPKLLDFSRTPVMQESAPQTFTITNVGGAPTGALKVQKTGSQFNVTSENCNGLSLTAAGATKSCTVTVTFTASGTDVDADGNIVVTDDIVSVTVPLHGTGVQLPAMAIEPATVCPATDLDDKTCIPDPAGSRFVNMVVGKSSAEEPFKVVSYTDPSVAEDSGTIELTIAGEAAADFTIVQNNCTAAPLPSLPLAATSRPSCVVTVVFKPSAAGLRKAVLNLTTSRGATAQATLEAKGLPAVELQPLPTVATKTGLDFGQVALGHDVQDDDSLGDGVLPYRVWVRDTSAADGKTTVTVSLPTVTLPDFVWPTATTDLAGFTPVNTAPAVPFAGFVDFAANSNPCTNKVLDLAAATNTGYTKAEGFWYCDFAVQFFPKTAKGTLSAELSASATGGGSSKLNLTGTSTGPLVVRVSERTIEGSTLDEVTIGEEQTTRLTIMNQGIVAQTGLTFELSGSEDFHIVGTDCWGVAEGYGSKHAYTDFAAVTLLGGDSCHVFVGFAPKTAGGYSVTFKATAANGAGDADNESGSATIVVGGNKTLGEITITPDLSAFGDVVEGSTTAAAVTFTVKNTGSLTATDLVAALAGDDPNDFAILPATGATACDVNNSFTLVAGGTCTIRVAPRPSDTTPTGATKAKVEAKLTVVTEAVDEPLASLPGGEAALSYDVISSLTVRGTGAAANSISFAFEPTGKGTEQTQRFVVTNNGSTAATLSQAVNTPFEVIAGGTDLNPAACKYVDAVLDPGQSCTLVLVNKNTKTVDVAAPETLTISASGRAGTATVSLSGTALDPSKLVVYGLMHDGTTEAAETTINLGTVPFSTGNTLSSGQVTVWFKNEGKVPTQDLAFRWDNQASGAAPGTTDQADLEFKIVGGETSCIGKPAIGAGEICSMTVQFKPDYQNRGTAGERVFKLTLIDHSLSEASFLFKGSAIASQGVYVQDTTANTYGFAKWTGTPTPKNPGQSEAHTLKFIVGDPDKAATITVFPVPSVPAFCNTVTLGSPDVVVPTARFVLADTQPTSNACELEEDGTLLLGGEGPDSCLMNVVFSPTTSPLAAAVLQHDACDFKVVQDESTYKTTMGLMGIAEKPVTLEIKAATTAEFGTIGVGQGVSRTFTVTNTGDVGMATGAGTPTVAVSLSAETYFKVTDDGCVGDRLGKGESCVVTVEGRGPNSGGAKTATLTATDGTATSSPATLVINILNQAALTITAKADANFGSVPVGGEKEVEFTITNATGAVATGLVKPSVGASTQYSIADNDCPETGLAAAGTCYVTVKFAPTALSGTNDVTAIFTAAADPGVSGGPVLPDTVTLSGMPVPALTILNASPINLTTATGPGVGLRVQLNALSTKNTAQLKTSLTGTGFMLVRDLCWGKTLEPGDACEISVKYIGRASSTAATTTITVSGGEGLSASVVVNATNVEGDPATEL